MTFNNFGKPVQLTHRLKLSLTLCALMLAGCALAQTPVTYHYRIIAERAHAEHIFTQGLLLRGDTFYESGGHYGQSSLVSYNRKAGAAQFTQNRAIPAQYFAEGLTELGGRLYLLTWRENTLMVFDKGSFELVSRHHYVGEGWGLTDDTRQLIRSDGSHKLFFHRPEDFALLRSLEVHERGKPVFNLNELEYVQGRIWANIWHGDRLVEIDPETGKVTGHLDLSALVREFAPPQSQSVLNGIAWDEEHQAIWVTGKNWPKMFLLKLSQEED